MIFTGGNRSLQGQEQSFPDYTCMASSRACSGRAPDPRGGPRGLVQYMTCYVTDRHKFGRDDGTAWREIMDDTQGSTTKIER